MSLNPTITWKRVEAAVKRDIGFCTECGEEHTDIKPDEARSPCANCGEKRVYGAATLLTHPSLLPKSLAVQS